MHHRVQTSSYGLLGCGRPEREYARSAHNFLIRVCEVCAQLFNKVSTGFLVGKKNSIKIVLTLLTNNYYEKNNFTKINVPAMRPGSRKWKCVGR